MCRVFAENTDSVVYTTDYQKNEDKEQYRSSTMHIVSKFAYLAGLSKSFFEKEENPLSLTIFDELEENKNAKIIRCLTKIRMSIILNFTNIHNAMKFDMKNLDTLPDFIDQQDIKYLRKNGIEIIKVNYRLSAYLADMNKYISENINACKDIFPIWVEWKYLKELLIMPKGACEDNVRAASKVYTDNRSNYPYGIYLSWAPKDEGNIFYNDKKFLELVYNYNGEMFYDYKKVTDASVSTKKDIYNYLDENGKTILIVDCENSDPYKLYGTIRSLRENELDKISKIILIDDEHTTTCWDMLENFLKHIQVKHILVDRVNERKSLVDMQLAMEVMGEHYENNINSFILCSSDSDFWPLMKGLKNASFLVMMEYSKCGEDIIREMDNSGIMYCALDDFSNGDINDIVVKSLTEQVEEYIKENLTLNVNTMLDYAFAQTRVKMSEKERKQFYDRHIKNMRLQIQPDGNLMIALG